MRKVLKWIGIVLGSLVGILLVAVVVMYFVGKSKAGRTYPAPAGVVAATTDPAAIARGEHIMRIQMCQECHGDDLGGKEWLDIPPGKINPPNLTRGRGGIGASYGPQDWDRVVRYGVRADSTSVLPFMPWELFHKLNDADAADLASYLASMPPVDRELPPTTLRLPGYMMMAMMGRPEPEPRAAAVAVGPTAEFGRYRASTTCVVCHGEDLLGGHPPDPAAPPAPGLVHTGEWSPQDFARAVREGVRPDGRPLHPAMPAAKHFSHLTDVELAALQAHIRVMPRTRAAED